MDINKKSQPPQNPSVQLMTPQLASELMNVLKWMSENGYKPTDAKDIIEKWMAMIAVRIQKDMLDAFSEEEQASFDKMAEEKKMSPEDMAPILKEAFIKKSGKNPDDMAKTYLIEVSQTFLKLAEDEKKLADAKK